MFPDLSCTCVFSDGPCVCMYMHAQDSIRIQACLLHNMPRIAMARYTHSTHTYEAERGIEYIATKSHIRALVMYTHLAEE
jgi:hypothetical protein